MNSDNPYQFSAAEIDSSLVSNPEELELADLITRLGAAFVDGLFVGLPAGIIAAIVILSSRDRGESTILGIGVAMIWVLIALIIQANLVSSHSATFGKKMLQIKIVRMDGSNISWPRWLFIRQGIVTLVGQIPIAGGIFSLIDILMIFGAERRCIHDLIADTKVVKA